ncbi:MAG: hypothetical protein E6R04_00875 [Spirochaetes bacterium]|jgi:hypothetical protein|nr:MAG: hypothetical protein E6R04_00875 [Spirochaetota bacterium]
MAKEVESLIVVSKVKDVVKELEMRSGDEFIEGLNAYVHNLVKNAAARAKANDRSTLRSSDL